MGLCGRIVRLVALEDLERGLVVDVREHLERHLVVPEKLCSEPRFDVSEDFEAPIGERSCEHRLQRIVPVGEFE